jgi:hypothetical protein
VLRFKAVEIKETEGDVLFLQELRQTKSILIQQDAYRDYYLLGTFSRDLTDLCKIYNQ